MDLNYTPEDVTYRKQVRAWLEENLPREEVRTLDDRRRWHRKLYEAGYLGMGWPKEVGGAGARPMEQAIVADEMARLIYDGLWFSALSRDLRSYIASSQRVVSGEVRVRLDHGSAVEPDPVLGEQ